FRVTGLLLLAFGLMTTVSVWPAAFTITSLTTIGPDRAARLSWKLVVAGRVMVLGAAGDPMTNVPPVVPATNPLVMHRLLVMVIGPASVRLNVSPGALSMAIPVVSRIELEISRSPPVGRKCWLFPLLMFIW